ncbi:MAG: D-alanyl-D-alanine carboxypeptidase family protein [Pseudomonadota bacterium]
MTAALRVLALLAFAILSQTNAWAQGFETTAEAAYVFDHNSGQVLLEHNADLPLPPASMSKLMVLYMTFEALRDGRLSLDTVLPVSENAMSYQGSTMFLTTRDRVSVEDLIRGIVVLSGNDASAVLAEALSPDGTEDGFAVVMTERARELGMASSTFRNSNGWPAPGHVMSMRDLGILAERIITDFPEYYPYFAETEFEFDGRAPDNRFNRNPLLYLDIGADGLKTGRTQEAGFGLVGSVVQGDRRVTFVITGLETADARERESQRIVTWAFRQFAERVVLSEGDVLAVADVFLGETGTVDLTVADDVALLLPAFGPDEIAAEISYGEPLPAPLTAGTEVGEIVLRPEGMAERRVPLVLAQDVAQGGFLVRVRTAAEIVLERLFRGEADLDAS